MKHPIAIMTILAALSGCAAFDQPMQFALENYPGDTPLERTLAKANLEKNRNPGCGGTSLCQLTLPNREELAVANWFDCKAYVMSKAYALQDAGIDESRMRVAQFDLIDQSHVVLVVDEHYVLDNLDSSVRRLREYTHLEPVLASLPSTLMARNRGQLPVVAQKRW